MPPDNVLAFDTSAAHCAAALILADGRIFERFEPMEKGQAERLLPLLEDLLAEAGISWQALTVIGVGIGPGNFTGVRISVATARGLALGLGIKAIGITTLEAAAHRQSGTTMVALDARRGQVYLQLFAQGQPVSNALLAEMGTVPEGIEWRAEPTCVGDAAPVYQQLGFAPGSLLSPLAVSIAEKAKARAFSETRRPAPFYLRGADAAPPSDAPPVILP